TATVAGGVPESVTPAATANGGHRPDPSRSIIKARIKTGCERKNATPLSMISPTEKKLRTRATNAAAAGELKCSGDMRLDETRVRSGNPAILQGQQPRGPEALRPRLATSLPLVRRLISEADLRRRHRIASWI